MKRIFVAIDPPNEPERAALELKKTLATGLNKLRFVRQDNYHITIAFIQATSDAMLGKVYAATESVCARHKAMTIGLDGWVGFPSLSSCRTVALTVVSEPLVKLASDLTEELTAAGAKVDCKSYTPHLTIARVKGTQPLNLGKLSRQTPPLFVPYKAAELKVYQSVPTNLGFIHQTLKVFPISI